VLSLPGRSRLTGMVEEVPSAGVGGVGSCVGEVTCCLGDGCCESECREGREV
jgi:hypothetical protein